MDGQKVILILALKYNNDWNLMYDAIRRREPFSDDDIARADAFTGHYITILDNEYYPKRLRKRIKPPFLLYYEGDLEFLKQVDENDGDNKFIFLYGPNDFDIPNDRLVRIDDDYRLNLCDRLTIWFNDTRRSIDRYGLAPAICSTIVCTKVYPYNNWSWFCRFTMANALEPFHDHIYLVPGDDDSWNAAMIRHGEAMEMTNFVGRGFRIREEGD